MRIFIILLALSEIIFFIALFNANVFWAGFSGGIMFVTLLIGVIDYIKYQEKKKLS